jgi:transcriptional regulator with PAS, ATPase and Fis domain
VLLLGETGTGKEVLARALHDVSGRAGELVALNCGALPANLLESTLFGCRKGAFSGAAEDRPGLVRAAHRGTLFLDEIGELSPAGQVALLRVLEVGEVLPLGETRPVAVDVRIVAATLRDLRLAAAGGNFRDDLLARLTGHVVETLPLRARREDLGLLLARLVSSGRLRWPAGVALSRAAAQLLFAHRWPHNVRELVHVFDAALVIGPERGELPVHAFEGALAAAPVVPAAPPSPASGEPDEETRLRALLAEHRGNLSAVARALATSRTQVTRLLERYTIDPAGYR